MCMSDTHIVNQVSLELVLPRPLAVHRAYDVDLVVLVGHIPFVHIDYVVSVVDSKSDGNRE